MCTSPSGPLVANSPLRSEFIPKPCSTAKKKPVGMCVYPSEEVDHCLVCTSLGREREGEEWRGHCRPATYLQDQNKVFWLHSHSEVRLDGAKGLTGVHVVDVEDSLLLKFRMQVMSVVSREGPVGMMIAS